jgi:hypothetical protein
MTLPPWIQPPPACWSTIWRSSLPAVGVGWSSRPVALSIALTFPAGLQTPPRTDHHVTSALLPNRALSTGLMWLSTSVKSRGGSPGLRSAKNAPKTQAALLQPTRQQASKQQQPPKAAAAATAMATSPCARNQRHSRLCRHYHLQHHPRLHPVTQLAERRNVATVTLTIYSTMTSKNAVTVSKS